MKHFLDTEFLEGTQDKRFLGVKYGKTKPTIDLISIGIVSEADFVYYAISKDFNLKEAWNRYDLKTGEGDNRNNPPRKVYWIRENVLKPIWEDLFERQMKNYHNLGDMGALPPAPVFGFSYYNLKKLINIYGQTNAQIAKGIMSFVNPPLEEDSMNYDSWNKHLNKHGVVAAENRPLSFYGYYADYDWVAFCWLWGKMMDLPSGFPMYCRDLKQLLDDKVEDHLERHMIAGSRFEDGLKKLKEHPDYPKQENEHSAIDDARWNKKLHTFLKSLK